MKTRANAFASLIPLSWAPLIPISHSRRFLHVQGKEGMSVPKVV